MSSVEDVCTNCFVRCTSKLPNCQHRMHDECKFAAAGICQLCSATTFASRSRKFSSREGISAFKALKELNRRLVPPFVQEWMMDCLIKLYPAVRFQSLEAWDYVPSMKHRDLMDLAWEFGAVPSRRFERCRHMRRLYCRFHLCTSECEPENCTYRKICARRCEPPTV